MTKILRYLHWQYTYYFNDNLPTRYLVQTGYGYNKALLPNRYKKYLAEVALLYYHCRMSVVDIAIKTGRTRERTRALLYKAAMGVRDE